MKKALITGITGQDGAYLAELLLSKGYVYSPRKSKTIKRINFDFWGNENKSIQ
jgi:GDPmannose 4,6-dehydratase